MARLPSLLLAMIFACWLSGYMLFRGRSVRHIWTGLRCAVPACYRELRRERQRAAVSAIDVTNFDSRS